MKQRSSWLGAVIVGGLSFGSAQIGAQYPQGEPVERAYSTIADRNPFGLKPEPEPTPVAEPEPPPVETEIKLTGISSFGNKRAYFMVTAVKDKTTEYYALGVDEKKDDLEVIDIDGAARSVRIRKEGIETVMTFASHGIAAPVGAAPAKPGVPGAKRVGVSVPGVATASGGVTPRGGFPGGNTSTPRGVRTIPSRSVRTQPNATANSLISARYGLDRRTSTRVPTPESSNNTLSSEEQALLMELRKVANPNQILPPTPGIPQAGPPIFPGGQEGLPALPGQ